jgi:hypothetical protein
MRPLLSLLVAMLLAVSISAQRAIPPGPPAPPSASASAVKGTGATGDVLTSLEGIWSFSTLTPLERPQEFAGKEVVTPEEAAAYEARVLQQGNRDRRDGGANVDVGRAVNDYWFDRGSHLAVLSGKIHTSLITDPADGRVPALTPDARAKGDARVTEARKHPDDGPEDRSLQERCLVFNAGPPILPGPYNNSVEIHQTRSHVLIFNEMIHDARIVPLDGRPHVASSVHNWMGDPRGRWEGHTLVVDSTNFSEKTSFRGADERLHLVERFTPVDADTMLYEFTVDDPTVFTRPWSAALPMKRTGDRMFEYACHEGNYALQDILRGARVK